jgi:hypothetical protein
LEEATSDNHQSSPPLQIYKNIQTRLYQLQTIFYFHQKHQKTVIFKKQQPVDSINRLSQLAGRFCQQSTGSCNLREAFVNNQQALATCGKVLTTINKLSQLSGSYCQQSTEHTDTKK